MEVQSTSGKLKEARGSSWKVLKLMKGQSRSRELREARGRLEKLREVLGSSGKQAQASKLRQASSGKQAQAILIKLSCTDLSFQNLQ